MAEFAMVRLLLLLGIVFLLVKGVENHWVDLHWNRFLHDVGVPFVPDPDQPAQQEGVRFRL
jgi:hypothetical protein